MIAGELALDYRDAEGYANAPVALGPEALLQNVRAVQRRNQLHESSELFRGMGACQLDVEMGRERAGGASTPRRCSS